MIGDALDHFSEFCNAGIVIFDDASTDNTLDICNDHKAVKSVVLKKSWDDSRGGRQRAEGEYRMAAFKVACQTLGPDWIFCFDADERPELNLLENWSWNDLESFLEFGSGIRLRLYDYYITPEDVDLPWNHRKWIGPEFRDILMFFNARRVKAFPDREPAINNNDRVIFQGFVKHYGKAISVEDWEKKCLYYGNHLPEPYQSKWLSRKGRAIKHDMRSDFGLPLIKWDEREEKGVPLTSEIESNERRRNDSRR